MSLKVHVYKCLFKFSFCHTCGFHNIFIFVGTLDRCMDGERAQIILENTISVTKPLSASSSSPVQVYAYMYTIDISDVPISIGNQCQSLSTSISILQLFLKE